MTISRCVARNFFFSSALVFVACGGISDPNKQGEKTSTVSGALTGASVPAGARVAVVWRTKSGFAVGGESAVTGGAFAMTLTEPSADAFSVAAAGDGWGTPGGRSTTLFGSSMSKSLQIQGGSVSGGITDSMKAALGGFLVYVDSNGNGKLDFDSTTGAPVDQIIGGNIELVLADLAGGGALDYEKLRDTSSVLPVAGFNLAWSRGRWLPLNVVELKITDSWALPSSVCNSSLSPSGPSGFVDGGSGTAPPEFGDGGAPSVPGDGDGGAPPPLGNGDAGAFHPSPGDPNLHCSADGRSYTYTAACAPPPLAPRTLCSGQNETSSGCGGYTSGTLDPSSPTPADWPCPTSADSDGGAFDGDGGGSDGSSPPGDGGFGPRDGGP